jgi:hypothetical protein
MNSNDLMKHKIYARDRSETKGIRLHFPESTKIKLEQYFQTNPYPTLKQREFIADELNIQEKRIRHWFQNYRHKQRKESKESERFLTSYKADKTTQLLDSGDFHSFHTSMCDSNHASSSYSINSIDQCEESVGQEVSKKSSPINFNNYHMFYTVPPPAHPLYSYLWNNQSLELDNNKTPEVKIAKPLFRPYE